MSREWSTFMDGDDCNECHNYEKEERRLKKRIKELESSMQEFVEEAKSFPSGSTEKDDWLNEWIQDFERLLKTQGIG